MATGLDGVPEDLPSLQAACFLSVDEDRRVGQEQGDRIRRCAHDLRVAELSSFRVEVHSHRRGAWRRAWYELMVSEPSLIIRVHDGQPELAESWVFVWLRSHDRAVTYVGATGLRVELRTWLHLNSEDLRVGRIASRYRDSGFSLHQNHAVLAFAVGAGVSRSLVKDKLDRLLADRGQLAAEHICDEPGEAAPEPAAAELASEIADAVGRQIGVPLR